MQGDQHVNADVLADTLLEILNAKSAVNRGDVLAASKLDRAFRNARKIVRAYGLQQKRR